MKKLYLFGMILSAVFAAAGCSKDSGIENDIKPAIPDSERQVVLTGVSNAAVTRTGFDETDGNSIPFIWSAGDYIWVNDTKSAVITESGNKATFTFESLSGVTPYRVYYNRTGSTASTAVIPGRAESGCSWRHESR